MRSVRVGGLEQPFGEVLAMTEPPPEPPPEGPVEAGALAQLEYWVAGDVDEHGAGEDGVPAAEPG